jgi:glycosyltransferase involved in cell wall biosynthesis
VKACLLAYKFYECSPSLMQFASTFADQGDQVDVICLGRENQPAFASCNGVNVYRLQRRVTNEKSPVTYLLRILKFLVRAAVFLSKRHLAQPYDLIHVQNVPDFLVFAAALPRILGVPVILDVHDAVPEFYASKFVGERASLVFKILVIVERLSAAFASEVIVPTHLWKERLISRSVDRSHCTVIRYLPNPRLFYPRSKQHENRFLIVYPGTLNFHQGVDLAIKAFALVLKEIPEAEFHIFGEGPAKPYLFELVRRLGVTHNVKLGEMLPKEQMAEVMAQSDLAVEPKLIGSRFANETCSVKLLEFMALGVPVVVSRTRVHEFYYNDAMIKFYDADDEGVLASAILALFRDEELRRSLACNALKYIQENNWLTESERYRELIKRVLCIRGRPGKRSQLSGSDGSQYPASPA